ncbi:MAG: PP2C family protein-serine/threonine phosphatase [Candidatus Acidiferrales bacterium]|jgi:serine phosphatase RsbU (regulator of sigma subunit)
MSSQSILEPLDHNPIWASERDEAREIQQSLLPAAMLESPACEVAYRFSPFSEVGGDFADFFHLPEGRIGIYIGDVVGKGLPAAMYSNLVMGMLRGIHKTGQNTGTALTILNQRLMVRPVAGRYSATLYAVFEADSLKLTFSNAGLPYPLLVSSCECRTLGSGGLPSGLLPDSSYETYSVQLSHGDAVLFATDGLHELRDNQGADFSWERLSGIWRQCGCKSARASLDFLFEEAGRFCCNDRHDDVTAVVLKIRGR